MKKNRLKNYLKLGILLFGISLLLINCEKEQEILQQNKDDLIENIQQINNSKYTLKNINISDYQNNTKLVDKISSLLKNIKYIQENGLERYDNVQFNLSLNEALYIEAIDSSHHSYTFSIYNEDGNFDINNIVLSSNNNSEEYQAYLVTYSLTEEERSQIDSGIILDLKEKTSIEPFDISQINLSARGGCYELKIEEVDCSCHDTHNPNGCTHPDTVYTWVEVDCGGGGGPSYNSNGEPTGNGGGSPSGGSTGSGNPDSFNDCTNCPIPTSPTTPTCTGGKVLNTTTNQCECPDGKIEDSSGNCECPNGYAEDVTGNCVIIPPPPCAQLKESISDIALIKTRLHQLKIATGNFEKGLRIDKNPTTGKYVPSDILNTNNGSKFIKIIVNPYTVVIAHTHPDNAYAMFSGPDIIKMAQIVDRTQNNSNSTVESLEITHILIADGKTFALRFDDTLSVQVLLNIYNDADKREKFEKKLKLYYNSDFNNMNFTNETDVYKQQHHLFNFLAEYNLNISLYEANYNSNGFVDNWQKVNKETLEKEPCN